jgi:hypothetical protein
MRPGPLIFLLGAGASKDAGMPLVSELTAELRERLPELRDMNCNTRKEFPALFDAIATHDPKVRNNYERFFEWLSFLHKAAHTPHFSKVTYLKLGQQLVAAVPYLEWSIKRPIVEIMYARHQSPMYEPSYYARLGAFLPAEGRLKVFTTNFDLCVEDACRARGINVITGFQAKGGRWSPSLFRTTGTGISLYKMHGSLSWGLNDDLNDRRLVERCPPDWNREPDLLLGPGSKLQHDDPFVTLYSEFHKAIRRSKAIVAIGYSFSDAHIKGPISDASRRGLTVVDVNPAISWSFKRHDKISMTARKALEGDEILKAIARAIV